MRSCLYELFALEQRGRGHPIAVALMPTPARGRVGREPGLERRPLGPLLSASHHGHYAFCDTVQPQPVLDLARIYCGGDVRAEPQLRSHEVVRLTEVRSVHEDDRVGLLLLRVLPVRPGEPGGHDGADVRRSEVVLSAREVGGQLNRVLLLEPLHQLEGVAPHVVVVDAGLDPVHAAHDRVGLDRVEAAPGGARALDAVEIADDRRSALAAPDLVQHERELLERHPRGAVETPRRLARRQRVVEASIAPDNGQLLHGQGIGQRVERIRRLALFGHERLQQLFRDDGELPLVRRASQIHAAPFGHQVVKRAVDVPPRVRKRLVARP